MEQVEYISLPEKNLKILHIVDLSKTGGVEIMFMEFLHQITLLDPNIEHAVFALRVDQDRRIELLNCDVKVYLPKTNKYNLIRRLSLIKIVFRDKYDIVHGQNFSGNFWAAISVFLKIPRGVKLVSHEHGSSWMAKGFHRLISQFWAMRSDVIICNSKAAAKIVRARICHRCRLQVVYNGVVARKTLVRQKKREDEFNILFVGRLEEVKGIRELVRSLEILSNRNIEYNCNILGDGALKLWLQDYITIKGLSKNIKLHGIVNNVDEFMANSDVLVLPSIREPLGNVILEAANQYLPVISSRIDGINEIVISGETGILLKPRFACNRPNLPKSVVNEFGKLVPPMTIDPVELADALSFMQANPIERVRYGIMAKEHLENFTIETYTNNILKMYLSL